MGAAIPPEAKTVAKWRKPASVEDAAMGPKDPRSTMLTKEEEALAVAFRKQTCHCSMTAFKLCKQ
jgi:hypothetical protein